MRQGALVPRAGALAALGLLLLVSSLSPGCLTTDNKATDADTINLYGFSVKGEVMDGRIIPMFQAYWKNQTGKDVHFTTVYAGSGTVTSQVISGAEGEVMLLSTEWDAMQLQKHGLVTTNWTTFPHNGTVTRSPWVIMTRSGNPKNLTDFPDLTKGGIELVHPDPLTSGGAMWSIFAIYGSELEKTTVSEGAPNATEAERVLGGVVGNVVTWQASARNALSQFDLGYGDALIDYECEALFMKRQGRTYNISYPESTIYSEHKVVIVDKNVASNERALVQAFVDFLYTPEAQRAFADYGFRSVDDAINAAHPEFKHIQIPFTIDYLGGWATAKKDIIDDVFAKMRK
jgi:sulfate transport system substrate-binding protein